VNTHWSFVARVYPVVMAYEDGSGFYKNSSLIMPQMRYFNYKTPKIAKPDPDSLALDPRTSCLFSIINV